MTFPDIETRLFIDGEFVPSLDGSTFKVTNPFSGETVAEVYEAKAEDVDRAVQSAQRAFPVWSESDGSERRRLMLRLADLVDEHAAEFARLEALSMGKPVSGYMDQAMGTATLRYYAGKALDVYRTTLLTSKDHGLRVSTEGAGGRAQAPAAGELGAATRCKLCLAGCVPRGPRRPFSHEG